MGRLIDLTGKRFGRVVVMERSLDKAVRVKWLCRCDCGRKIAIEGGHLRSGLTSSCGCVQKEVAGVLHSVHGESHTRLYSIWRGMKARCKNPNEPAYQFYGGRGITVCTEWESYEPFANWARNNGYSDELSIDRIDNNANYEQSNCRWANAITQANNTRKNVRVENSELTIAEYSRLLGVSKSALYQRRHREKRNILIERS